MLQYITNKCTDMLVLLKDKHSNGSSKNVFANNEHLHFSVNVCKIVQQKNITTKCKRFFEKFAF